MRRRGKFQALLVPILLAWQAGCFAEFDPQPTAGTKPAPRQRTARSQGNRGAVASTKARAKKKPEQSYQAAWRLICAAERLCGVDETLSRSERGAAVAAWLVGALKNEKARYWFINFGKIKTRRRSHFVAAARAAGQDPCALTELLFPSESGTADAGVAPG